MGRITIAYTEDHYFLKQEGAMLEDIARRISGYIENRRLMETTQAALAEAAATHRSYLRQEWQDYLQKEQALHRNAIVYDQEQVAAIPEFWRPEMELALTKGDLVKIEDLESRTGLAIPIVVRGQTLGVLGVEDPDGERKWSAEELALVQAIGQQLGQALENTRLIEATQRRAARERLTGEVTTRMRETMDVNTVLQTAVHEMRQVLGLHDIVIRLEDTNGDAVTPTDSNRPERPGRPAEQDEEVL
jgi:GAF domain-containing protein